MARNAGKSWSITEDALGNANNITVSGGRCGGDEAFSNARPQACLPRLIALATCRTFGTHSSGLFWWELGDHTTEAAQRGALLVTGFLGCVEVLNEMRDQIDSRKHNSEQTAESQCNYPARRETRKLHGKKGLTWR